MPWNQDPGDIWYFALFKSMTWYSDGSLKTQQWHGEHISKQLACVRTAILSHNFEHWQYKILTELPGLTVFSVGVTCCYRLTVTWAPTMTPVTTNTTPTWWYYRLYIQHLPPLQSPFIHTLQRSLSAHASICSTGISSPHSSPAWSPTNTWSRVADCFSIWRSPTFLSCISEWTWEWFCST